MSHSETTPVQHTPGHPTGGGRAPVTLTNVLAVTGITLALVAVVALVATRAFRRASEDLRVERGWRATPAETGRVRDSQAEKLAQYAVVDREKGVVTIPIQRAMKIVVAEAAGGRGEGPR